MSIFLFFLRLILFRCTGNVYWRHSDDLSVGVAH